MHHPRAPFPWDLDWNLLRSFLVIVEHGSITRAAHAMGVTQPSASAALKRIEDALQVRLIDRGPRHFRVTRAGRRLHERCLAIFGTVSDLPGLVMRDADELRGIVTLAMASHVVSPHLDSVFSEFASRHPGVGFALPVMTSEEVLSAVRNDRAIAGICLIPTAPDDLLCRPLYFEHFAIFCGPGHRAFGRTDIGADEWPGFASVGFQTETRDGSLAAVSAMRARLGLPARHRAISSSLHEVRRMIRTGIGVGALPVHVVADDVRRGLLWQMDGPEPPARIAVHLVTRPGSRPDRVGASFLEALNTMCDTVSRSERDYA